MSITIFDSETTGLLEAEGTDIALQPYFTEIYAMQVDDEGNIINELDTLIKPPIPIPLFITKKFGVTDHMLKDSPTFIEVYQELVGVFFGIHTLLLLTISHLMRGC